MSLYLLDTNVCIRSLNDRDSVVARKLAALSRDSIALSPIVKAELYFGAYRSSQKTRNLELLRRFFEEFHTLIFDSRCEEAYGLVKADLSRRGELIGPNDLFIAATALGHEAILVTHNTREFSRIEGLRIEDWEAS